MEKKFFTILFLPSNPSKVKKMMISEYFIKSLAVSALILVTASSIVFLDYVNVKRKEIDLTNLKEQTKIQNVQLQTFADKINDMETELARLRSLNTKIRVLTNTSVDASDAVNGRLSIGGKGGPEAIQLSFRDESILRDMMNRLYSINLEIKDQEKNLHELHTSIQDQESILASTPAGWPTKGYISSGYGYRQSPFGVTHEFHDGIDISTERGTPVLAAATGTVTLAGRYGDTGNTITLSHGYGYETGYGHLDEILVKVGDNVERGQVIGKVGSTGRSTGPHLHYIVKMAGSKINPRIYMD